MDDDLVRRLECYADLNDAVFHPWVYKEAADRIEHLENRCANLLVENGILNNRIEKLEDELHHCFHRINKLQAALREIAGNGNATGCNPQIMCDIARKALEGKDG